MKYRNKKHVVIEALQWTGNVEEINAFTDEVGASTMHNTDGSGELRIGTLEGVMTAQQGDFIIKGVDGKLYLCKPDIFEMICDPACTCRPEMREACSECPR